MYSLISDRGAKSKAACMVATTKMTESAYQALGNKTIELLVRLP
jgi:hypothetical protein